MIFIGYPSFEKRNRFKNMMITKDMADSQYIDEGDVMDEQIHYIPRVASGRKRGAILTWALAPNRMSRHSLTTASQMF